MNCEEKCTRCFSVLVRVPDAKSEYSDLCEPCLDAVLAAVAVERLLEAEGDESASAELEVDEYGIITFE